jgi:hypothetical protein
MDYVGFAEKLFVRARSSGVRSSGVQEFRSSGVQESGVQEEEVRSSGGRRKKKELFSPITNYQLPITCSLFPVPCSLAITTIFNAKLLT